MAICAARIDQMRLAGGGRHQGGAWAGSPQAVTRPGLPLIRTCAMNAYGSSGHTNAYTTTHRVDRDGGRQPITPQQPLEDGPRKETTPSAAR